MQQPKYSAFSTYNPPHPIGFKQPQPYPGHPPPYNNPVTVQNPGTTYVPVQPLPKLILYCPCCKIPWETYHELAPHCCGKSFDSFIHCGQPHCIKTFFKEEVNKYLDHIQTDHVQRYELGIPEPPPRKASPCCILIGIIFIAIIIIFVGLFVGLFWFIGISLSISSSTKFFQDHEEKVNYAFANDPFFQNRG